VNAPWYIDFFQSGDYARLYSFEPERSAREARFVRSQLGDSKRILDLCCGTGRHLRELNCFGIDLNLRSLHGLKAACADMRSLPLLSGSFDAVISLFSSFGYLESDEEDLQVLREVRRILKPRGTLLLDLLNREYALAGFVDSLQKLDGDGSLIVEQRSFDFFTGRLTTAFVIIDAQGERRESPGHSLRLYTLTELSRLLAAADLKIDRVCGGYAAEPYSLDSVRMIATISPRSW
jgi:SAM-dependent methyltransferase